MFTPLKRKERKKLKENIIKMKIINLFRNIFLFNSWYINKNIKKYWEKFKFISYKKKLFPKEDDKNIKNKISLSILIYFIKLLKLKS